MDLKEIIDAVDQAPKEEVVSVVKHDPKKDAEDIKRIQPVVGVLLAARVVFLAAAMLFSGVIVIAFYIYLSRQPAS